MEFITQIINQIIESFDFGYCVAVNILTYLIINIVDSINGDHAITTWQKRIILVFVIVCLSITYYSIGSDIKTIINSSILAPVFWSWICKPICDKLGIGYRKDIDVLEQF